MGIVSFAPSGDQTVVDIKVLNEAGKESSSEIAAKVKNSFVKKTLRLSMPVIQVDTPQPGQATKTVKKNFVMRINMKTYDVKANKVAFEEAFKTDLSLSLGVQKDKISINEIKIVPVAAAFLEATASGPSAVTIDVTIEGGDPEKVAGLPKGLKVDTLEGVTGETVTIKVMTPKEIGQEKVAADAAKSSGAIGAQVTDAKAKDDAAKAAVTKCVQQKSNETNCKEFVAAAESTAKVLGELQATMAKAQGEIKADAEGPKVAVAAAKAELEQAQKEGDGSAVAAKREQLEKEEATALKAELDTKAEDMKKNASTGGNVSKADVAEAKKVADQQEVAATSKQTTIVATKCDELQKAKPQNKTAISECLATLESSTTATKTAAAATGADATFKTPALTKTETRK